MIDVRIEHFEEVAKFLSLGFFAKFFEPEKRLAVLVQVVDESDGVKTEIRAGKIGARAVAIQLAALDVIDAGAAEWLGCFARVAAMPNRPNIRGVVRACGGRHLRIAKQPFLNA